MNYFNRIISFLGYLLILLINNGSSTYVHVNTNIGNVTGLNKTVKFMGADYHCAQFLGIPYADPPTGSRRFKRPRLYSGYHAAYNATFYRPHCMQSETSYKPIKWFNMSEDCLYLNIFTPGPNITDGKPFSVMVFIHGGSFSFGGADVFSGDVISAGYNVIVVTLNYRLNAFGFLSDGTQSSGNLGLWDQQIALRWVHDNIANFGGNPAEVTIMGSSSGAACALFHTLYPGNKNLFKRVIAQSGSFLAPWALQGNPKLIYNSFIKDVGCMNISDVTRCLRNKPAKLLAAVAEKFSFDTFSPVVDGDFIPNDPASMIIERSKALETDPLQLFSDVDFLSGVNSKEGASVFDMFATDHINLTEGFPRDVFEHLVIPMMLSQFFSENVSRSIRNSVIHEYTAWTIPDNKTEVRDNLVNLASDVAFVVPGIHNALMHSNIQQSKRTSSASKPSTYFYVFDAKTKFDPEPQWLDGAKHTMELPFVFGFPDMMKLAIDLSPDTKLDVPSNESFLSHTMLLMWTSFAKTGNPNVEAWQRNTGLPAWPTYNATTQQYFEFSMKMSKSSSKSHLAAKRVAFWTNVVPSIRACVECTCPEYQTRSDACCAKINVFHFFGLLTLILCLH